jgi:hypothetical protein
MCKLYWFFGLLKDFGIGNGREFPVFDTFLLGGALRHDE